MPSFNAWADASELRGHLSDDQVSVVQELGDVLDVGVLIVDQQLVVTGWNGWLERASGKRAASVIGRSLSEVEPNLRPSSQAALELAVQGSAVVLSHRLHGYLLDIPSPWGLEQFPQMQQSVRILPIRSADGRVQGAAAFAGGGTGATAAPRCSHRRSA